MAQIHVKVTSVTIISGGKGDYISLTDIAHYKDIDHTEALLRNWPRNSFTLTPKRWVEATGAIGITSKAGRYGDTYAHKDIAFEFASWVSVEFKLSLNNELQRPKESGSRQLGWDIRRSLRKTNYRIHTEAIKAHLIPPRLTPQQITHIYDRGADFLNMALFRKNAKQGLDENTDNIGNIRDEANASQLVCLRNLETLNAHVSQQGLSPVCGN